MHEACCVAFTSHRLTALIQLSRLSDAGSTAATLGTSDAWKQLGVAAMQQLDVPMAITAYRQVGARLSTQAAVGGHS